MERQLVPFEGSVAEIYPPRESELRAARMTRDIRK